MRMLKFLKLSLVVSSCFFSTKSFAAANPLLDPREGADPYQIIAPRPLSPDLRGPVYRARILRERAARPLRQEQEHRH